MCMYVCMYVCMYGMFAWVGYVYMYGMFAWVGWDGWVHGRALGRVDRRGHHALHTDRCVGVWVYVCMYGMDEIDAWLGVCIYVCMGWVGGWVYGADACMGWIDGCYVYMYGMVAWMDGMAGCMHGRALGRVDRRGHHALPTGGWVYGCMYVCMYVCVWIVYVCMV